MPSHRSLFGAGRLIRVFILAAGGTNGASGAIGAAAAPPPAPEAPAPPARPTALEQPGDSVGSAGGALPTRPAATITRGPFTSVQVNRNAQGLDVIGDAGNETTITADPHFRNRLAIGWRQFDTVASSFRQAGFAYSRDGGRTWRASVMDPGVFRTDPVLEVDRAGIFFYNTLRVDPYACDLARSFDSGRTWGPQIPAFGGDKAWMTIDRTGGPGDGAIYQAWNTAGNQYFPSTFNRSLTGGLTWTAPQELPGRPVFGTLAVGPDGELYVAGVPNSSNTTIFRVVRSAVPHDPAVAPVFTPAVQVNMGGALRLGVGPNPGGLLGQVWIAVCHAPGPRRGHVYVLCSVDPPGDDPMDVMFARSTDGGATFSPPVRVNDDAPGTNAWQWFGTMSVAPGGRIDAVWNDTRAAPGSSRLSQTYAAHSLDGGVTWSANVALGPAWDSHLGWPSQNKIGDYYHMISDDVGAHLAYAATFTGGQDVYYVRIGEYDCNGNGVADPQDIAGGQSRDCDADGIPDECEGRADWNRDGTVATGDVSAFLGTWFADLVAPRNAADYDDDGVTTTMDLSAFLGDWFSALAGGC
ncbi:MAG TPA: sialidase family protein [Phycisphaerales bacterium]|nr:sialidase family protein [Phycisphaerales bacterium]